MSFSLLSRAQDGESDFTLIVLSNNIHYDAKTLATEISAQHSLAEVKQVILNRIKEASGKVVICFRKGGTLWRWERDFDAAAEDGKTKEWIVLASREAVPGEITRPGQFRTFFGDTLVWLDTVRVRVRIISKAPGKNRYKLRYDCPDSMVTTEIPATNSGDLILSVKDIPPNCRAAGGGRVLLFNAADPTIILADFHWWTPDASVESEWLMIARNLQKSDPSLSAADLTGYLQSYIMDSYGNCDRAQLWNWINRHKTGLGETKH